MSNEDENEEADIAKPCAYATRKTALVEEEAKGHRPDDLGNPVDKVVESTRADVEQGAIVVIEFYVISATNESRVKRHDRKIED